MATDILNAQKAHKQKAVLENKLKGMSGFDPDYDAVKGMVRTLREEEQAVFIDIKDFSRIEETQRQEMDFIALDLESEFIFS